MTAGRLALGAIALATAFWLGTRWHRAPAPAPPAAAAQPADAPLSASGAAAQAATASGSQLDAAALRQIVREELAQQAAAAPRGSEDLGNASAPAAPADPAAAAAPPLDDAAAARADDAAQIIEQAIRAGRWTASDRTRFAASVAGLPPPTRVELQRALHVAINRGQVTPADGLPPFAPAPGPQ